jgi:hypothetical protein
MYGLKYVKTFSPGVILSTVCFGFAHCMYPLTYSIPGPTHKEKVLHTIMNTNQFWGGDISEVAAKYVNVQDLVEKYSYYVNMYIDRVSLHNLRV